MFYREISYGMTGSQNSVLSVCGGSRFAMLGDGWGFMEKLKFFISLMEFIASFFHCVRRKSPRFLQKLSFDKNLAEKPKSSDFETIYGFFSSILVELISTYQIFKFLFIFPLKWFQAQLVNRPETKPGAQKFKNSKCSVSNQILGEG